MPIYEYQCNQCLQHLEIHQKMTDPPKEQCPQCGGLLTKLLSASAFHLKGSGWYKTDYASKSANSAKTPETKEAAPKKETTPKPACETCPANSNA